MTFLVRLYCNKISEYEVLKFYFLLILFDRYPYKFTCEFKFRCYAFTRDLKLKVLPQQISEKKLYI